MATDTVSSDHPTTLFEQAEKEVPEEVKTMEGENVPLTKENEVKPKEEDSPSPVVKIEDTISDSTVIEEPKKNDEEEKPKSVEPVSYKVENEEPNAEEPSQVLTEEVKKVDEDEKPIADEAAPVTVEEVKKDNEVEKPTVEAPPSAIIEELKSTDEAEKQKAEEEQKPIADEPVPTIVEKVKTADEEPTIEELPPTKTEEVKKSDEEEKPKADELAPTVVEEVKKADEEEKPTFEEPPATIIEEVKKSVEEEKPIADETLPPTIEEVKEIDEPHTLPATTHDEEKPKAEELPSIPDTSAESEEKIEDKEIEPPTVEEVTKQDETLALGVTSKDIPELTKEPAPEPESQSIPDQVADVTKSEPEVQAEAGNVETLDKEPNIEPVEEKPEQPTTVEVVEAVEDKKEQVDLEASEPQKASLKEEEVAKAEPKEEVSEPAPIVEEKPTVATENIEQEAAEAVTENEEVIPLDKVEEVPKEEPVVAESSNQITSTTLEALMQKMDEENPTEVAVDNAVIEEKEKELVPEATVAEAPPKEEVENIKTETKDVKTDDQDEKGEESVVSEVIAATEAKVVETSEGSDKVPEVEVASRDIEPVAEKGSKNEEKIATTNDQNEKVDKNVTTEELAAPEAKGVETSKVAEKAPGVEITSRDIEPIAENGSTRDDTIPTTEANEAVEVEKKVDEATANATAEPLVEEAQKSETETKDEKIAEGEEIEKTEAPKDGEDKKTTEEVPIKTKQSNNLMSKVKQSLVKAKKAIIGKSPSSKTDTKNEVKTK